MPSLESWLESAQQDAERRQLPALRPLLEGLGRLTAVLRAADWNIRVAGRTDPPARHDR